MRLTLSGLGRVAAMLWMAAAVYGTSFAAESPTTLPPISQRFAKLDGQELPSFQRHVVNLFGRLGCNGRACHGSFQGQGGFRLSLFGYDFKADHGSLLDKAHPRVDVEHPDQSLIITKPTDGDQHEGGQRYQSGSWQHHVLLRWIRGGARLETQPEGLAKLAITPAEIWFQKKGERVQLKAVAEWEDGTREDVTPLCRFQTNNEQVATIDDQGRVTAAGPGDTHVVVYYDNGVVPVPVIRPLTEKNGPRYPQVPTPTRIDELVVDKLRKLGIQPSDLCREDEFLRRVSLDLTGTLPTVKEVEQFLADKAPNKRAKKIDELLGTPAYAAWWATKLCDFTGNSDEQLNNVSPARTSAAQDWYDWIYKRVAENVPYDQLAAGIVTATSRQPGEDYLHYCQTMSSLYQKNSATSYEDLPGLAYYWARRDFRDADARAVGFAYSFLGIRIQCAQCHKHPFDQWSKDDFHQFKNFFAGVVAAERSPDPDTRRQHEELVDQLGLKNLKGGDLRKQLQERLKQGQAVPFPEVFVTKARPKNGKANAPAAAPTARLLGGAEVDLTQHDDPRTVVLDWLRDKSNPYFARAFANRVWAAYFNVGIVNPPDDHSRGNPPSNKPLLDYLAEGFIRSKFDMKWLHRQIANSRTYQLSWRPNDTNRNDETNFSRAVPRRLPAEVAYDALQLATASDAKAARMRTELDDRAIAIPGSTGRGGRSGNAGYALTAFGRSTRRSNCECDRSEEPSLLQTVYLQNDRELLQMIETRPDGWLTQVTPQLRPKTIASAEAKTRQTRELRNQVESVAGKLKRAQAANDKPAVERLTARLTSLKQQLPGLEPPAAEAQRLAELNPVVLAGIVQQAYLRTLSRHPDTDELARAQRYLSESEDPVKGARDLLWTLVNTKEFIVNH